MHGIKHDLDKAQHFLSQVRAPIYCLFRILDLEDGHDVDWRDLAHGLLQTVRLDVLEKLLLSSFDFIILFLKVEQVLIVATLDDVRLLAALIRLLHQIGRHDF